MKYDDAVREAVTGEKLSDEAAKAIAAGWQSPGSIGSVLASVASGAWQPTQASVEALGEDIRRTIDHHEINRRSTVYRALLAVEAWGRSQVPTLIPLDSLKAFPDYLYRAVEARAFNLGKERAKAEHGNGQESPTDSPLSMEWADGISESDVFHSLGFAGVTWDTDSETLEAYLPILDKWEAGYFAFEGWPESTE